MATKSSTIYYKYSANSGVGQITEPSGFNNCGFSASQMTAYSMTFSLTMYKKAGQTHGVYVSVYLDSKTSGSADRRLGRQQISMAAGDTKVFTISVDGLTNSWTSSNKGSTTHSYVFTCSDSNVSMTKISATITRTVNITVPATGDVIKASSWNQANKWITLSNTNYTPINGTTGKIVAGDANRPFSGTAILSNGTSTSSAVYSDTATGTTAISVSKFLRMIDSVNGRSITMTASSTVVYE